MLTAYNVQSQQILATHARKEEVYHCPICKEVLILRQGVEKVLILRIIGIQWGMYI
ncbi:competence protein CoiA family protein [Staphylococcus pseudintermedius]|uniref:competence protein CoiA family protein n=1 Tax=Staphylococcus pseudintermedius TaxID=283734 RepID=UPI0039817CBC